MAWRRIRRNAAGWWSRREMCIRDRYYTAADYDLTAMGGEMYSLAVTFQQVFRP